MDIFIQNEQVVWWDEENRKVLKRKVSSLIFECLVLKKVDTF